MLMYNAVAVAKVFHSVIFTAALNELFLII